MNGRFNIVHDAVSSGIELGNYHRPRDAWRYDATATAYVSFT